MKTAYRLFGLAAMAFLYSAQVHAGGDGWAPALAAAREVSTQIDSMQRAFASIPPTPTSGRGLYAQADGIRVSMYKFKLAIKDGLSKEDVAVAFFLLDGQVNQLLSDLQTFDNPAVIYVARRLKIAETDLHFAVVGPGANPTQKAQSLARQTLALAARAEDFEVMARFAFLQDESLPAWMAAIKDVRQSIAAFKTAQEKNAPAADVKAALVKVDQAWEKVVDRLVLVPDLTYVLVQTDAVQFDSVLGRVDRLVGVENRKGRLPAKLLQP